MLFRLTILVLALAAFIIVVMRRSVRTRSPQMPSVTLREVPDILTALSSTGLDGNFAVFLFGPEGQPPASVDALNIQFSIEGGHVGIDWVLLAPLNLESQSRFVEFFERKGRPVARREQNQVKYLRVEGERLAELMREFLVSEFKVGDDQTVYLIAQGFPWSDHSR
jgi:hypothetical protein